jgi:hypothetical protein
MLYFAHGKPLPENQLLEKDPSDVDAKSRQIISEDGRRLSISASAQRIHDEHTDFPIDLIEIHVMCWLEMEFCSADFHAGTTRRTGSAH